MECKCKTFLLLIYAFRTDWYISLPHSLWLWISWKQWSNLHFHLFRRGETSASWSRSCARPRRGHLQHDPQVPTPARNVLGTTAHRPEKDPACSWSNRQPTRQLKSKCWRVNGQKPDEQKLHKLWAHKQKRKTTTKKQERLNRRTFMKTFSRVFSCIVVFFVFYCLLFCTVWVLGALTLYIYHWDSLMLSIISELIMLGCWYTNICTLWS